MAKSYYVNLRTGNIEQEPEMTGAQLLVFFILFIFIVCLIGGIAASQEKLPVKKDIPAQEYITD